MARNYANSETVSKSSYKNYNNFNFGEHTTSNDSFITQH